MNLVLASASPRRRDLLTQAGIAFRVQAAEIDESQREGEDPGAYTTRLAREKAQAVFAQVQAQDAAVLGADTTVAIDGRLLGKPVSASDARHMLRLLAGRAHAVTTGIALVMESGTYSHAETTQVFFAEMTDAEIEAYVATGEPMDKAGAYAIQGRAARWIARIEGDFSNVVGLPLAATVRLLKAAGLQA